MLLNVIKNRIKVYLMDNKVVDLGMFTDIQKSKFIKIIEDEFFIKIVILLSKVIQLKVNKLNEGYYNSIKSKFKNCVKKYNKLLICIFKYNEKIKKNINIILRQLTLPEYNIFTTESFVLSYSDLTPIASIKSSNYSFNLSFSCSAITKDNYIEKDLYKIENIFLKKDIEFIDIILSQFYFN